LEEKKRQKLAPERSTGEKRYVGAQRKKGKLQHQHPALPFIREKSAGKWSSIAKEMGISTSRETQRLVEKFE